MSKHVINIDDLISFESKTIIAASHSVHHPSKHLYIVSEITTAHEIFSYFVVSFNNAEQLSTTNLEEALIEYNKY